MVTTRADVTDLDALQRDTGHGRIELPTIVKVQSVAVLPTDLEVAQGQIVAAAELKAIGTSLEMRRIRLIKRL